LIASPSSVLHWTSRTPVSWRASSGSSDFTLGSRPTRVTYWIAPGRRIILLTVFIKTRPQERREVRRASEAMERCAAESHTADDEE
jgi:hypothetical protein